VYTYAYIYICVSIPTWATGSLLARGTRNPQYTRNWIVAHIWTSHATNTNESWRTTDARVWAPPVYLNRRQQVAHTIHSLHHNTHMRHGAHMNESPHIYEWVRTHLWISHMTHMRVRVTLIHLNCRQQVAHTTRTTHHTHTSHGAHMNETCHTYEWGRTQLWISHTARMRVRVTHINTNCRQQVAHTTRTTQHNTQISHGAHQTSHDTHENESWRTNHESWHACACELHR